MTKVFSPIPDPSLTEAVQSLASQCVKCGLCLPHCPTYAVAEDENESPRGRIELLKAVAEAKLPLTAKVEAHLDRCLTCRACEPVCPAKVRYGKLITKGRALIQQFPHRKKRFKPTHWLLNTLAARPPALRALHWILWLLEAGKIRTIAQTLKIPQILGLGKLDSMLPAVTRPQSLQTIYPAQGEPIGRVGLFLGCFQRLTDHPLYEASIKILTHLGYEVHLPPTQTCCGALALHAGHAEEAQRLALHNVKAFGEQMNYVVSLASGCGSVMQEYDHHFNPLAMQDPIHFFAKKMVDISSLVLKTPWPKTFSLKKFPHRIAVHSPCTLKNVCQSQHDPIALLKRIPEAEIIPLNNPYCCGAAGSYLLDFPEFSNPLVGRIVDELNTLCVTHLASSNIGCILHLKQSLKHRKVGIQIDHPIVILSKMINF